MLKDWRDAGFFLGNHTWSHMNLNTSSLADWQADLLKNEPTLEQYAGNTDWHWLRYPFLAEGDTPEKRADTRKFLAAHGIQNRRRHHELWRLHVERTLRPLRRQK